MFIYPGGNAITWKAGKPLVTGRLGTKLGAKLAASWGQRRNFEGGKTCGHWDAGGKAGGKAGGNAVTLGAGKTLVTRRLGTKLGAKLGATT